jgi:hypothetical protein
LLLNDLYSPYPGTVGSLAPEVKDTYTPSNDTGVIELIDADVEVLGLRIYRCTAPDGTVHRIDKPARLAAHRRLVQRARHPQ